MYTAARYLAIDQMAAFYGQPLGHHALHALRHKIHEMWPDLHDQRLLAYGYPLPYLKSLSRNTASVFAFLPAPMGAVCWPQGRPNQVALVSADGLPLSDNSVDRILLVHALEFQGDGGATLDEFWRVLSPGGRLLAVAPNRRSFWAAGDKTPFGYGEPFSRTQLGRVLKRANFELRRTEGALYFPPVGGRRTLGALRRMERLGNVLWPNLAGALVIEAEKRVFAGTRAEASRLKRPKLAGAFPEPIVRKSRGRM